MTTELSPVVPMGVTQDLGSFHDPPPLPALSPALGGGEGGRRPGEGDPRRFMVPMHGRKAEKALQKPLPELIQLSAAKPRRVSNTSRHANAADINRGACGKIRRAIHTEAG